MGTNNTVEAGTIRVMDLDCGFFRLKLDECTITHKLLSDGDATRYVHRESGRVFVAANHSWGRDRFPIEVESE